MPQETMKESIDEYGTVTVPWEVTDRMVKKGLETLEAIKNLKFSPEIYLDATLVIAIFDSMIGEAEKEISELSS